MTRGYWTWPDEELRLPEGDWRLDPFNRVMRFVPANGTIDRTDPPPKKAEADCGTISGPAKHRRRSEPVCGPCRDAHAAHARDRYKKRAA